MKHGAAVLDAPTLPAMELIPPREADVEGVFKQPGSAHHNRIIYTETELDLEATKASAKVKLDANGNEVWKKNPNTGEAIYPILVKTPVYRQRRYVLWGDDRNRHVKKVYHFEMTAQELAEVKQKEAEATFFRDFVAEAAKAGLTAAQVIAKIKADILGPGEQDVELSVTEEVVAAEMAKLDSDMIERPEAEDENVGIGEDDETPVIHNVPVRSPSQRRRKGKA